MILDFVLHIHLERNMRQPAKIQRMTWFPSQCLCCSRSIVYLLMAVMPLMAATTWAQLEQQAYLKASNTGSSFDSFGFAVAISGNTIVIGAKDERSSATGINSDQTDISANDAGAVYVFVREGTAWSQQAYIKASNTEANDIFGTSVSIAGDTLVVGASRGSQQRHRR